MTLKDYPRTRHCQAIHQTQRKSSSRQGYTWWSFKSKRCRYAREIIRLTDLEYREPERLLGGPSHRFRYCRHGLVTGQLARAHDCPEVCRRGRNSHHGPGVLEAVIGNLIIPMALMTPMILMILMIPAVPKNKTSRRAIGTRLIPRSNDPCP